MPLAWEAVIAVDPTSAALAYLDLIPHASRRLADATTTADHWRIGFEWIATGAVLILIFRTRIIARVRERLTSGRLVSVLCAILFVLLMQTALAMASVLSAALWPIGAGTPVGLIAQMSDGLIVALIGGLGLWLLLMILRRWPGWGWVWLSVATTLVIGSAVLIPPVTLLPQARHDRVVAGPEAAATLAFVRKGGLDAPTLYTFDSPDPFAVDMEGLGPIAHAAVGRFALAAPRAETYAAIGHLLGHYQHKDLWSLALIWSTFAVGFFGAISLVRRRLASRIEEGAQNSAIDAKFLPILGLTAWALALAATPAFNVFDQVINYRADDYAMSLTHDPDALCRWLIDTEAGGKSNPSAIEALLFYDHPPLKARLINAMRWKAAHGGVSLPGRFNGMFPQVR